MTNPITQIGFGDKNAAIGIYFQHKPPVEPYQNMQSFDHLTPEILNDIVARCSNNWRKLFNCYAKLAYLVDQPEQVSSWQAYRDKQLLNDKQGFALLFSTPNWQQANSIKIIAGKTYASQLNLPFELIWLSPSFAINGQFKCIVSPYFDYRQLTNQKTEQLAQLIKQMLA